MSLIAGMLPPTSASERDAIAAFLAMQQQTMNSNMTRVPAAPNSSEQLQGELSRQLNGAPPADPNSAPNPHPRPSQQLATQPSCHQPILSQQQPPPPPQPQQSLHTQCQQITVSTKDSNPAADAEAAPYITVQGLGDRPPLADLTQPLQLAQAPRPLSPCQRHAALSGASMNPHGLGPLAAGLIKSRGIQAPGGAAPGHTLP
ncbi:hypothetical protein Vretifemale_12766, partial [Volvox reticuliferus]